MNALSEHRPAVVWGFLGLDHPLSLVGRSEIQPLEPRERSCILYCFQFSHQLRDLAPDQQALLLLPHLPHSPPQAFIWTLGPVIRASSGRRVLECSSCGRLLIVGQSPSQSRRPWPPLLKLCTPQTLSPVSSCHFFIALVHKGKWLQFMSSWNLRL